MTYKTTTNTQGNTFLTCGNCLEGIGVATMQQSDIADFMLLHDACIKEMNKNGSKVQLDEVASADMKKYRKIKPSK